MDHNKNKGRLELENYVTGMMLEMGVPAHLKGYHFIREAIMIACGDMEVMSSVTKLLYPEIARRYHTTSQKVERAIRNAIEVSWQRGKMGCIEEVFGYTVDSDRGRPTNSEYIARLADQVRLEHSLHDQ